MVKRCRQDQFTEQEFDADRFNLHAFRETRREVVVVFVHGFGGHGYKTWANVPHDVFARGYDVGIFDYRSGPRRLMSGARAAFDLWVQQLRRHLEDLEKDYKHIFLVGHSLGGKVVEAVAKEILTARAHSRKPSSLAALVLVASPRAGTTLAPRILTALIGELSLLTAFSPYDAATERYYKENVERANIAESPGLVVLPAYAVVGIDDRIVQAFSALVGIPVRQRLPLAGGHGEIVKPQEGDEALLRILDEDVIHARLEVLQQADRESMHSENRTVIINQPSRSALITRFLTDSSGMDWEHVYNEVRAGATSGGLLMQDHREDPIAPVDAVIAIHAADLVAGMTAGVRKSLAVARSECDKWPTLTVSLNSVGETHALATEVLNEYIAGEDITGAWYVSGAPNLSALRDNLARFLESLRNRDPRRNTLPMRPRQATDAIDTMRIEE
ncbi:alpha/beta hydrolase [Ornithinimicrobium sp. EGI L100131]|nr:alpha/beta fold hydrolase [Ornithinimicrobium sediminis]MCE0485441.1 alpha/beta hydrolase [Ornithinimicrobium sediminis]